MSTHTLMFGWEYPPAHLGGLGVACQGLVNGLLSNNVRVTLALPHAHTSAHDGLEFVHPTEESWNMLKETIRIDSLLQPYDSDELYLERQKQSFSRKPREMGHVYGDNLHEAIETFTQLSVEMTRHVDPDVVHCHDWMTYGAGMRAADHHGRPLVAHIHATELDRTHFSPNQWIYERERDGFEAADCIVAVSGYTKNILTEHYGIKPDKITVVHNGSHDIHDPEVIHVNSQARREHRPMVLFLGRLALQKGAGQFLEMAAQVHAHRPDVQFVVAGDGHMLGELVDRSIAMSLQDSVIFAGKVNSSEARKLYAQASCFVMPSLSEPFGLVALEAIAQGTPVIMSRQSGAAEVVRHAFVVDFWDTAKMADCVLTVLREDVLAHQLRTHAPHILSDLTWHNQATLIRDVYHNLLSA